MKFNVLFSLTSQLLAMSWSWSLNCLMKIQSIKNSECWEKLKVMVSLQSVLIKINLLLHVSQSLYSNNASSFWLHTFYSVKMPLDYKCKSQPHSIGIIEIIKESTQITNRNSSSGVLIFTYNCFIISRVNL